MTQEALAYTQEIQTLVDLYGLTSDRSKGTGPTTNASSASSRNPTLATTGSSGMMMQQDVIAASVRPFGRKFVLALGEFTNRLRGCLSTGDVHGLAAGQTGANMHTLSTAGGFSGSATSSAPGGMSGKEASGGGASGLWGIGNMMKGITLKDLVDGPATGPPPSLTSTHPSGASVTSSSSAQMMMPGHSSQLPGGQGGLGQGGATGAIPPNPHQMPPHSNSGIPFPAHPTHPPMQAWHPAGGGGASGPAPTSSSAAAAFAIPPSAVPLRSGQNANACTTGGSGGSGGSGGGGGSRGGSYPHPTAFDPRATSVTESKVDLSVPMMAPPGAPGTVQAPKPREQKTQFPGPGQGSAPGQGLVPGTGLSQREGQGKDSRQDLQSQLSDDPFSIPPPQSQQSQQQPVQHQEHQSSASEMPAAPSPFPYHPSTTTQSQNQNQGTSQFPNQFPYQQQQQQQPQQQQQQPSKQSDPFGMQQQQWPPQQPQQPSSSTQFPSSTPAFGFSNDTQANDHGGISMGDCDDEFVNVDLDGNSPNPHHSHTNHSSQPNQPPQPPQVQTARSSSWGNLFGIGGGKEPPAATPSTVTSSVPSPVPQVT